MSVDSISNALKNISLSNVLAQRRNVSDDDHNPLSPKDNLELARYFAVLQATVAVYVFLALLYYSCKKGRSASNSTTNIICLISSACCVLMCFDRVAELYVTAIITCNGYHIIATSLHGVGLGLVYTALWLRQRKLYCDKLLQHTVTTLSRRISSAIIVVIYFLLFTVFASFVTVLQSETLYPPCHIHWFPLSSLLPLLIFFILTCFFLQLVLFILILNPLRKGSGICDLLLCSGSENEIFLMLKRLAICACACIFSTILLSIAILLDAIEVICVYWGNLVSLDLTISIIATVFSFQDWDCRLLPLCPRIKRSKFRLRHSVVLNETHGRSRSSALRKIPGIAKKNGV